MRSIRATRRYLHRLPEYQVRTNDATEHSTGTCFAIRLIQVASSRLSSSIPGTNIYGSMDGSHKPIDKSKIGFNRFTGAPNVPGLLTSSPNLEDGKFHGCQRLLTCLSPSPDSVTVITLIIPVVSPSRAASQLVRTTRIL